MVEDLLRGFVAEPWLAELDLAGMDRINAKFHAEAGTRREGDIVWRIPLRRGGDAYLLLLLEFQSRPERWMALRLLVYVGLLWQQLIQEGRIAAGGRLPPVLPIVLYNGEPRWTVPLSLHELIDLPNDSPFWPWQPTLRYHVIDEGAAAPAAHDTLAALLFELEQCQDLDRLKSLIEALIAWFDRHPTLDGLKSAFALLVGRLINTMDGGAELTVPEDLLEVRTMLTARAEEWKRQWIQQGREQGTMTILLRQLERRFGTLPDWTRDRVAAAEAAELEEWSLRVLDAKALADVFH